MRGWKCNRKSVECSEHNHTWREKSFQFPKSKRVINSISIILSHHKNTNIPVCRTPSKRAFVDSWSFHLCGTLVAFRVQQGEWGWLQWGLLNRKSPWDYREIRSSIECFNQNGCGSSIPRQFYWCDSQQITLADFLRFFAKLQYDCLEITLEQVT